MFWCDFTGEWTGTFNAYSGPVVTKPTVAGNEFSSSAHIFRDPKPEAKFLIYVPTANGFDTCLRALTPFPRMPDPRRRAVSQRPTPWAVNWRIPSWRSAKVDGYPNRTQRALAAFRPALTGSRIRLRSDLPEQSGRPSTLPVRTALIIASSCGRVTFAPDSCSTKSRTFA